MTAPTSRAVALILVAALCSAACAPSAVNVRERAIMLADKGDWDASIRELRTFIDKHPPAVAERRLLIRIQALKGDLGSARREAEQLAKLLGPTSPVPWIELGHAYELSHRYEEAIALYDRAAEVAPRDPAGPREGGMRAARWGEVELAEPRLAEALRRDPRDAAVWHALGLVRAKQGDRAGAREAYESGLRADPQALENRVGLATLALARGDASAALAQYDALVAARPRFADARLGRSLALIELGRLDEAERALGEATRLGADRRAVAAQRRLLRELRRRSGPAASRLDAGTPAPARRGSTPAQPR